MAPIPRNEKINFDPGTKYHIAANVPYLRYFIVEILQFQFHRAMCGFQGITERLYMCDHGLDRNNLERLRFYAVRRPEKLDKAFRYLCEKISRYLNNRNRPYVILGITVMNDIVKSCYQLLNTFVDDYLETLRLVLEERDDLELIEQAVASFESFCEIREEAPNYQRNYQFFVHRFTALCYYHDEMNRIKLRCLGLRGHHALFRKTANDELQNDAWKHMDQIMPSIIFNMEVEEQNQSQEATY
ncbi:unnamed protein product [Rotaria magnacalcarata]|uniref:Uncharacterized protein n=1 Tax=Rotaria magnacalcarata TaxID=392030 RepID=A0A8S2Q955_9BILA|nr:unnamed protein product [Rotaria magnacalcarata]